MILLVYEDGDIYQFDGEYEDLDCGIVRLVDEGDVKVIRYNSEYSLRRIDSPSFQLYNAVEDIWEDIPSFI